MNFHLRHCSAFRLVSTKNRELTNKSGVYSLVLRDFEIYGEETDSNIPKPSDKEDENPPTPPIQTSYNVALKDNGGVASTNHPSSWAEENGYGILNLNDGRTVGTFFISDAHKDYKKTPIKVAVGFNDTYKINEVKLYATQDGGFPVDFTIEVYTDGSWKTVVTQTGYNATVGWQAFEFEAIDCTAVRVHTSQNGKTDC